MGGDGQPGVHHGLNKVEVWGVVLSFLMSCFSLLVALRSNQLSERATQEARNANELSTRANEIATGEARVYPVVEVERITYTVQYLTLDQIESGSLDLTVYNRGELAISGVQFHLIGMDGLSCRLDDQSDKLRGLGEIRENVEFSEELLSRGFVQIDIAPVLLRFVRQQRGEYKDPSKVYEIMINFITLPRATGRDMPVVSGGHAQESDRISVTVQFVPEAILSDEASKLIERKKVSNRIFPPLNTRVI